MPHEMSEFFTHAAQIIFCAPLGKAIAYFKTCGGARPTLSAGMARISCDLVPVVSETVQSLRYPLWVGSFCDLLEVVEVCGKHRVERIMQEHKWNAPR